MSTMSATDEVVITPEIAAKARELAARHYPFVASAYKGGWAITFPDLPGAMADAETFEEIGFAIQEALVSFIETQLALGKAVPDPSLDLDLLQPTQADYERAAAGRNFADAHRLISTAEAAERLGMSQRRVQEIARARKVGHMIGRDRKFTEAEIEELRPGATGRPLDRYVIPEEPDCYHDALMTGLWGPLVEAKNWGRPVTFWLRDRGDPVTTRIRDLQSQRALGGLLMYTVYPVDPHVRRIQIPGDVRAIEFERV